MYLDHLRDRLIVPLMKGTANVSLKPSQLAEVPIDLPPIADQRRTVDLVDALDRALRRALEIASASRRLGQELASREWTDPAYPHVPITHLVGAAFNGHLHDGDWVETKDQSSRAGDSVRLLQLADIGLGAFLDKSDRWISPDTFLRLRCTEVVPGDVLISRMADPIGRAAKVPALSTRAVTAVDVAIARLDPAIADSDYWTAMLNAREWLALVGRFATGTTRQRISRGNLEQVQVPLTSLERQRALGEIFGGINLSAAAADRLASALVQVRAAILSEILLGDHVIPASYDRFLDSDAA